MTTLRNKLATPLLVMMLALGGFTFATTMIGCEDDNPIEEAGEDIQDAADDVGDEIEDAVE